jgi:hypothetical protein
MGNFLIGLVMAAGGFFLVSKTEFLLNNFGRIGFFDQYLGTSGGSRLGYKLFGMLGIFLGTLTMFGLIDNFMGWLFAPLLRLMM